MGSFLFSGQRIKPGFAAAKRKGFLKLLLLFIAIHSFVSCNVQRSVARKIDVTGNWQIEITTAEGTIMGKGSLSQTVDAVTGWVGQSETDPIPVTGTVEKNELTLKTLPQPGRTVAFYNVVLKIEGNKMSGAIGYGSHGKGTIKFMRSK